MKRDVVALVEGREAIANLLTLNKEIDLCIPRGSNAMVQHIMGSTKIPTLGHADGICHMYIDASADPDKAARLAVDAKTDYPAACNAIETLLLHDAVATGPRKAVGQRVIADLRAAGVKLFGGPRAAKALGLPPAASLRHEYGELAIAVETVSGADAAIDHVNAHGSGHTDVVVAEDAKVAEAFMSRVDSADVFHNCSSARRPPGRRANSSARNASARAIPLTRASSRAPRPLRRRLPLRARRRGRDLDEPDPRARAGGRRGAADDAQSPHLRRLARGRRLCAGARQVHAQGPDAVEVMRVEGR